MYSFKGFYNRFLKVLLKAYDGGRQHVDDETEWEIFFSGYLFFWNQWPTSIERNIISLQISVKSCHCLS